MFICKVEEENVVCLAIDALSDGVGLVGYESGEYAKVPHSRDNVVPVGLAEVEVCFFGKQEGGAQLPTLQAVNNLTEDVLNYYLAIYATCVSQVYDYSAAFVFCFQQTLI